ncbi:MAG: radical SAM protein [Elusimicrobiota bacterium]|nr:radical SAM protein [Elusimicrobiota bacterium]
MSRPTVHLVQAPAWGPDTPPYGLAVLKAYLTAQGFPTTAADWNLSLFQAADAALRAQWEWGQALFWTSQEPVERALAGPLGPAVERLVAEAAAGGARVFGFSVVYTNERATLALARRLKAARPDAVVVLGGPQAAKAAGGLALAADPAVDFVVDGEGEVTFVELLRALESGGDPAAVPGLLLRRDGLVRDTGKRPLLRDLDALPPADYADFDLSAYAGLRVPVSISRGCPNRCAYCYEVAYWETFRTRKGAAVAAEALELHARYGRLPGFLLSFHDSLVNGHIGELRRFAEALVAAGRPVPWSANAVVRKEMTPELLRLLAASGCRELIFGLETASTPLMLSVGKVLARDADAGRLVRDTREAGIATVLNFMFGLPGETEEDFNLTLEFVRDHKAWISQVSPCHALCLFPKGTTGRADPAALGIRYLDDGEHNWESLDGTNTLPVRMDRFERFIALAYGLDIPCTRPQRPVYLKPTLLAGYHDAKGSPDAAAYIEAALESDPPNDLLGGLVRRRYFGGTRDEPRS